MTTAIEKGMRIIRAPEQKKAANGYLYQPAESTERAGVRKRHDLWLIQC